jgi:hypothetical protein
MTLAECRCDFGGVSFWLKISWLAEAGRANVSNYTLAFALQLRKGTENLSQCGRLVLDTSCCVGMAVFKGSVGRLAEH